MKTELNKFELKEMDACEEGYKKFVEAHGDKTVTLSQALDSNGWDDICWFISEAYEQFSDEQKQDLRVYGCNKALINIEKIKVYCSEEDYNLIVDYLNDPNELARSAAWSAARLAALSAARSAAESAESAAESAESAAWLAAWSAARSAARSARLAARLAGWSAESAAMEQFKQELKELFLKWEGK